jgi:uncharacterized protein (UPF0261 family)
MIHTILLVGTLDTKGAEYDYVRGLIERRGHQVLMMDAGVSGDSLSSHSPDIGAAEVAVAGGGDLQTLREQGDRNEALTVMSRGCVALGREWFAQGRFDGVIALGGSGGTALATALMRELPIGVPKVMVSTLASGDVGVYVGTSDIAMLHSVVDIAGLNRVSRRVLGNAVGAICGMVEQEAPPEADARPLIAASMFGVTTPCVTRVRERLEQAGFETLVFHANGSGGRAMEAVIASGLIVGVADVTTTEWCDELVGGLFGAGPQRLDAAAQKGIPQVVSCGALDMVNFRGPETVPTRFEDRHFHAHNANVTLMRTTPEECAALGRILAEKLNAAGGPVTLLLPLRGVSAMDMKGGPFFDPDADAALFDALRRHVQSPPVELIALDLHINDPAFADAVADHLLAQIKQKEKNKNNALYSTQ